MTDTPSLRVKIAGVGGVGTWLINALVPTLSHLAPSSTLMLVDGDTFEPKNASRQLFDPSEVGNKATVVAKEMRSKFPNVYITDIPAWVVPDGYVPNSEDEQEDSLIGKVSVSDLMDEGDIWILSLDNNKTRKLFLEAAANFSDIDIISGGNGSIETQDALTGSVYHYRRRDNQDVTGSPLFWHAEEYDNPQGHNPGELSCQERAKLEGGTQLVVANMTVAALMMAKISTCFLSSDQTAIENSLRQTEVYFDWHVAMANHGAREPKAVSSHQKDEKLTLV